MFSNEIRRERGRSSMAIRQVITVFRSSDSGRLPLPFAYCRVVKGVRRARPNLPNRRDCAQPKRHLILEACAGERAPRIATRRKSWAKSLAFLAGKAADMWSCSREKRAPESDSSEHGGGGGAAFVSREFQPQSRIGAHYNFISGRASLFGLDSEAIARVYR